MKKTFPFAFSMLSLLVLSLVGIAAAYNADYTHTLYQSSNAPPTIDGTYIVDDDWIASGKEEFGDGAAFHEEVIDAAGNVLDRDKFVNMLKEYYRLRGWDEETGLPQAETLVALGLDDLVTAFP